MAEIETVEGTPERISKAIGDILATLIVVAVIVMMVKQFA